MGDQPDLQVQWLNADVSQQLLEHIHEQVVEHFLDFLYDHGEESENAFQVLSTHAKKKLEQYVFDDVGDTGVWNVIVGQKYVGAVAYADKAFCYFEIFDARQTKVWPQGRTVLFCMLWMSSDPVARRRVVIEDQVEVTTPRGYKPGDTLPVKLPDGRVAAFKVPKDAKPGKTFYINPAEALGSNWR